MSAEIGLLKIESGVLLVSDPCYLDQLDNKNLSSGVHKVEVPNGEFPCSAEISDEGAWGRRVAELRIDFGGRGFESRIGSAYVDSGQMSFMDFGLLPEWGGDLRDTEGLTWDAAVEKGGFNYQGACAANQDPMNADGGCGSYGHLDNRMVISGTGYGDGSYPVYVGRDSDGKVTHVRVEFLSDDEDDYDDANEAAWDDDEDVEEDVEEDA